MRSMCRGLRKQPPPFELSPWQASFRLHFRETHRRGDRNATAGVPKLSRVHLFWSTRIICCFFALFPFSGVSLSPVIIYLPTSRSFTRKCSWVLQIKKKKKAAVFLFLASCESDPISSGIQIAAAAKSTNKRREKGEKKKRKTKRNSNAKVTVANTKKRSEESFLSPALEPLICFLLSSL